MKIGQRVAPGVYYQGEGSYALKVSTGRKNKSGNYHVHTETFHGTVPAAIKKRAKLITEIAEGRLKPVSQKKITLEDYFNAFHEHNKARVKLGSLEQSTADWYQVVLSLFKPLYPMALSRITAKHILAVLTGLKEQGKTVGYMLSVYHAFRAVWRKSKLLKIDVPDILEEIAAVMPEKQKKELATLTTTQIRKLLATAKGDPMLHGILVAFLSTAGRLREVLALREEDIDEDLRLIKIANQLKRKRKKDEDPLKHHKTFRKRGVRYIGMTELFAKELPSIRAEIARRKLRAGNTWQDHGLLFPTTTGTPISADRWRFDEYYPLFDRAGVPRLKPHGLRHTVANFLLENGENPQIVMDICGHTEIGTTVDIYGHIQVSAQRPAMGKIDKEFG